MRCPEHINEILDILFNSSEDLLVYQQVREEAENQVINFSKDRLTCVSYFKFMEINLQFKSEVFEAKYLNASWLGLQVRRKIQKRNFRLIMQGFLILLKEMT
jgi:hypothetical protein